MKPSIWNSLSVVIGVVLLAVLGPFLARELRSLPHPRQLAARANARVVTLEIGGMHCSGCAKAVRGELEAVPGVSAAEVRLADERAIVLCDPAVADSALISAVHRAGPGFTAGRARD